jgi:hypothetical protein
MKPARSAISCLLAGLSFWTMLPGATAPIAPTPPPVPTVIQSDGPGEMVSTETETTFTFRDKVIVTGTNLKLTCDLLVVVAKRTGDPTATLGKQENFKSLIATGNVRIVQGDREALCGRAEVLPGEDKVILKEKPIVRMLDGTYEASGPEMLLERGQRRAVILGTQAEPTRILLPPLKDLGYEAQPEKKSGPATPAPGEQPPTITVPRIDTK